VFVCAEDGTAVCDAPSLPAAPERCDRRDNDCDGVVDNGIDGCLAPCDGEFGCAPDADTRALLVVQDAPMPFDGPVLAAYLDAGGVIITGRYTSIDLYNAVYGTEFPYGRLLGNCQDNVVSVTPLNLQDPFWLDNPGVAGIDPALSGCGTDLTGLPDITPLGGWTPDTISLAYIDHGFGRLWLVEADWRDNDTLQPQGRPAMSQASIDLVSYMIHHAAP